MIFQTTFTIQLAVWILLNLITVTKSNCSYETCIHGQEFCDTTPMNNGRCQDCGLLKDADLCSYSDKSKECLIIECKDAEINNLKDNFRHNMNSSSELITSLNRKNRDLKIKIANQQVIVGEQNQTIIKQKEELMVKEREFGRETNEQKKKVEEQKKTIDKQKTMINNQKEKQTILEIQLEELKNNFTISQEQNQDKNEKIENIIGMMRMKNDLIVEKNKQINNQIIIIVTLALCLCLVCGLCIVVDVKERLLNFIDSCWKKWKSSRSSSPCCGSERENMSITINDDEPLPEKDCLIKMQTPEEQSQADQNMSENRLYIQDDEVENQEDHKTLIHNRNKTIEDKQAAKENEILRKAIPDSRPPIEATAPPLLLPPTPPQTSNLPVHQVNQPTASENLHHPSNQHFTQQSTDVNQTHGNSYPNTGEHAPVISYQGCNIFHGGMGAAFVSQGHTGNVNINPPKCRRDCDEQDSLICPVTRARQPTECSEATYDLQPPSVPPDDQTLPTSC